MSEDEPQASGGSNKSHPTEERPPLGRKVFFPREIEAQSEYFSRNPVAAIQAYLECFDSNGCQTFEVPQHLLEYLAATFSRFMHKNIDTLDRAFGGRTAQQRNALLTLGRDKQIVWDYIHIHAQLKQSRDHLQGTPSEIAYELTGQKHGISADAVRAIYKRLG